MNNSLIISDLKINWGGANQFYATLKLIECSVAKWPFAEYFHFISGQDFPTKRNRDLDRFFDENKHRNFLSVTTNPHLNYRYDIYYPRDLINTRNCPKPLGLLINACIFFQQKLLDCGIRLRKKLPFKVFKGSSWWSLNRAAIDYILRFIKEHPSYSKRFKYTNCCDEIFFHTILFNSSLKDTIVEDDLRYIDWTDNGRGFPNVLDESDFEKIKAGNNFFCRKVISGKSNGLQSLLEQID